MKIHTNNYKEQISTFGRQLDSKITFTLNNETIVLGAEDLNSVSPHFQGDILKSVMKQLDIDSNIEIPVGTELNYQFGVLVNGNYEYVNFGNYIVYASQKMEDYNSWQIICYDKMLYSMVDYEAMNITYPITIRDYISAICTHLGLIFKNASDEFANYDKEIPNELYLDEDGNSLGYKFRDVLDELSQVTASTICINEENDDLEIRYITDTNDVIDEEFFKDVNVDFGKKYGPINSIVLSRSAGADNVFLQDEISVQENGLCEIKIEDNQILNGNDRSDYLEDILEQLNGIEYYINDFSSPGIMYYNVCDRYTARIDNKDYTCIMLNDEALITQGLQENIHTDLPIVSETDYSKADKTDRKINQTTLSVDKINGEIEGLVSKTNTIDTTVNNNYQEITKRFDNYTPVSRTIDIETSVRTLQTDTYTKTEINTKLTDGSVTKVQTVSGTFDENGMTYEKTNAQTKTTINEVGINTKRTSNNETILFAGYVDDNNTQYADYKGQTIVATENILVKNYLVVGSKSRFEDYEDGTGCFYIG